MPPTWKTNAATWLSPGHQGPHCFHMGCRQHSLLAIKIAEDKKNRQQVPLGKFLLQAGLLNLYMFYFFIKPVMRKKLNRRGIWRLENYSAALVLKKFIN